MKENDIVIKRISSEEELWFAERLYLSSFPDGERREIADWIRYTWTKPEFFNNIIEYGGERVGFISYWGLDDFLYVEHFAMDSRIRGKGYGGIAIETLVNETGKVVVLEVELPTDEMSKRRVGFYERHGFKLCEKKYVQPPYKASDCELEMKIMWCNAEDISDKFDRMVACIYNNVYKKVSGKP